MEKLRWNPWWLGVVAVVVLGLVVIVAADDVGDEAAEPAVAETDTNPEQDAAEEASESETAESEDAKPGSTLTLGVPAGLALSSVPSDAIDAFIEDVRERTGGNLAIETEHRSGPGIYEEVTEGSLDAGASLQSLTPDRFPVSRIIEAPLLFESAREATEALWLLYDEFPELRHDYEDVEVIALWADPSDLYTSFEHEITTLDDVSGHELLAPGPKQADFIAALGGTPIEQPPPEFNASHGLGEVDGLMVGRAALANVSVLGGYLEHVVLGSPDPRDVLPYWFRCNCSAAAHFVAVNREQWEDLSSEEQAVLRESGRDTLSFEAARAHDEWVEEWFDRVTRWSQEHPGEGGVTVLEGQEFDRWREAARKVTQDWIAEKEAVGVPAQEMHERLLEFLDQGRSGSE